MDTVRSKRLVSSWAPGLLVVAVAIVFVVISLSAQNWDANSFVLIGPRFDEGDAQGLKGYDGQFAYYMVLDPLGAVDKMDEAPYRYLRIMYPALIWLLSFGGNAALVPWVMIGINVFALGAIAVLLSELLSQLNVNRWYGVVVPLTAGMLFALRADLNEPLALAFALGAVVAITSESEKWGLATVLLALSALTKEAGYLYAAAIVLWLLVAGQWRRAIRVGVGSFGPVVVWGIILSAWLGRAPIGSERTAFEVIPFAGLRFLMPAEAQLILLLWIVFPTIVLTLALARDVLRGERSLYMSLLFINVLFVTFMPRTSYIDAFAVIRLAAGMMAAALLWSAAYRPKWLRYLAALWVPSGLLVFVLPGVVV